MNNHTIETTNWLTKGISEEQIKIEKALSVIAAKIYTKKNTNGNGSKSIRKVHGSISGNGF